MERLSSHYIFKPGVKESREDRLARRKDEGNRHTLHTHIHVYLDEDISMIQKSGRVQNITKNIILIWDEQSL